MTFKKGDLVTPDRTYSLHNRLFGVVLAVEGTLYRVRWLDTKAEDSYADLIGWQITKVAGLTNP